MRSFWGKIPMLRVFLGFTAGVLAQLWLNTVLPLTYTYLYPAGGLALLCIAWVALYPRLNVAVQYKLKVLNGAALTLLITLVAFTLSWFYTDTHHPAYFGNYLSDVTYLKARIIQPPLEKEKFINIVAEVQEARSNRGNFSTTGKILLNVLRSDTPQPLQYGDVIGFWAKVNELKGPTNPGEFDYKRYQQLHNIYHSTYVTEGSWTVLEHNQGNTLMGTVYKMRGYLLGIISREVKDTSDFGVASAIMLGYNQYMNREVLKAYTSSGVLHVLSVSGLHVAIVFVMLNFLLGWMDNRGRPWVVAKAFLVILFIWYYACLTGLSPSVLRAAAMFSMVQVGRTALRHVSLYNIIAASAVVLMLFNPFIITEAGFLLSYLAVVGIVFLYPVIAGLIIIGARRKPTFKKYTWYKRPYYFLRNDLKWFFLAAVPDFFWQLTAVSIAAQIATLPLSLYYFHQIPLLALVSNLVVIPASNLALFTGTIFFAVAKVPYLGCALAWLFTHIIHGLNYVVFAFNKLPFAVIGNISITLLETLLLYLFIALCGWLTEVPRTKVIIAALLVLLAVTGVNAYRHIQWQQQKVLAVYDINKVGAWVFINGRTAMLSLDSALAANEKAIGFHLQPHWINSGINQKDTISKVKLPLGFGAVCNGKNIVVVDTVLQKEIIAPANKLNVEVVILSHSARVSIAQLQKLYNFKMLVFDSSNRPKRLKGWIEECEATKTPYWSTKAQGAFIKDLS